MSLSKTATAGASPATSGSGAPGGGAVVAAGVPAAPPTIPLTGAALALEAANSDLALPTVEETEFDTEFHPSEDAVDLRAFDLVGGVFHFDLLQIPPQPKEVREWKIVESEFMSIGPSVV